MGERLRKHTECFYTDARSCVGAPRLAERGREVGSINAKEMPRPGAAAPDYSPPMNVCGPAKLSNLVYCPRNVSRTGPMGPLRCLPMMISAVPLSGLSGL